jgi:hypothetical protein
MYITPAATRKSGSHSEEFFSNPDNDDDVYLKKITTRVSQNLIIHKNADQPKT